MQTAIHSSACRWNASSARVVNPQRRSRSLCSASRITGTPSEMRRYLWYVDLCEVEPTGR